MKPKKIREGHFDLLGAKWPNPRSVPFPADFWNLDPTDGSLFPQRDSYCFDISFRHSVNTREIKRIWELNRLQFLVPLAAECENQQRSGIQRPRDWSYQIMDGG